MPRDRDTLEIKGGFDLQGLEETVIKINWGLCSTWLHPRNSMKKTSIVLLLIACLPQQESGDENTKYTQSPEEEISNSEYEAGFH